MVRLIRRAANTRPARKLALFLLCLCLFVPAVCLAAGPTVFHKPTGTKAPFVKPPKGEKPGFAGEAELLEVAFIDIGIGDAVFLRCGGETMLIDGGTRRRSEAVELFLSERGVTHLTYMFNTHAHDDHTEGLVRMTKAGFTADQALSLHPREYRDPSFASWIGLLDAAGIPFRQVMKGEKLKLGAAELTFIRDDREGQRLSLNCLSMMLSVRFGERTIFLPADASGESLSVVAAEFPQEVDADVMKSPHHGINRLRQDFLDAVSPELVVITSNMAGGENLAKQLLRESIPHYYISMGTVHLLTDGETWEVSQDQGI